MNNFTEEEFNQYLIDLERKGLIKIDHEHDTVELTPLGWLVGDIFSKQDTSKID